MVPSAVGAYLNDVHVELGQSGRHAGKLGT